jgi:hypothetical protein
MTTTDGGKGESPPIIQVKKARTDQEPRLYEIMMSKMRDHHRYFAPIEKVQPIMLRSLTKRELKKCADCGKDDKEYVRITRRETGKQTLEERIAQYEEKLPSSTIEKMEDYYEHIVEGLSKLKDAHIVHFNIQASNIMYSDTEFCPVIMDFSEAFVLEDLFKDETMQSVFRGPHPTNRCMEAKCISQIIKDPEWKTNKPNISELEKMITTTEGTIETEEKAEWKKYIKTFAKKQGKVVVNQLMANWHTWDLYSVNRIFCKRLKCPHVNPGEPYEKMTSFISAKQ